MSALIKFFLKQLIKTKTVQLKSYIALYLLKELLYEKGYLKQKSLQGEHVFITGAGSGLGRSLALKLAHSGCKVTLIGRTIAKLQQVEKEINSKGYKSIAIQCDVTSPEQVKNACKIAQQKFGDVDILINNAGIVSGKTLLESSEQEINSTISTNLISLHYTVRELLPSMIQRNHGHIITVASTAGIVGVAGLTDYCASKSGAIAFDESLRMELRKLGSKANKIKTTCLNPYFIDTGMFDGVEKNLPIILPVLKEEATVQRMVNAILQEEQFVVIPSYLKLVQLLKAVLPVNIFDQLVTILGINKAMETFNGKKSLPKL